MPVLDPSEYDVAYFDPWKTTYSHNAGYSRYRRWFRVSDDFLPNEQSTGEFFDDLAEYQRVLAFLDGKTFLEVGCAKGYLIEYLRDHGIDAWGLDVSEYAIGEAREDIKPYLIQEDARTYLPTLGRNDFNVIFSRWTLPCFNDDDLINIVIPAMNYGGFLQVHMIWPDYKPEFYNCHPMDWWLNDAGFKNKTVLIERNNVNNPLEV